MKIFLLLCACIMYPCTLMAWAKSDSQRESIYWALHTTDWAQTHHIVQGGESYESNPILGRQPSAAAINTWFITTGLIHTGISYALPPQWRKRWQWITIGLEGSFVVANYNVGIRVSF